MRRNDHPGARVLMVLALLVGMLGMVSGSTAIAETGQQPRVQTDALALQAGRTDLAIRISSSDPAAASRLGNPTNIRLTQGSTVRFNGNITNTPTLPGTFNINPTGSETFPQGTYTLTINAGSQFDVFTQTVNLNQPTQTVNVTLQVNDEFQDLIDELIAILIQILEDIVAGTPTVTPTVTGTATNTATATATTGPGTSTPTSVPPTTTPTATATATQPPADLTTLTVDAAPSSVVTGGTSTVTVVVTGRTGPTGGRLLVVPSEPTGATFSNFVCSACSNNAATDEAAQFTYGANSPYTARFTFQVTSATAAEYTISVTADDTLSPGDSLTRTDTVTFTAPTPTATATSTAAPTNTPTNTPTTAPTNTPTSTPVTPTPPPAITLLTVTTTETDLELGETQRVTIRVTGQANAGSTLTLNGTNITDGLDVAVVNCGDCTQPGGVVTYAVSGAYDKTTTLDVTVPDEAADGEEFTLEITAIQNPGGLEEVDSITFTIDAPE